MIIRNIWGVGRNYAEHAQELGNEIPVHPMIFLKAGSCATINSNEIAIPEWATEVHHEVELALKFSSHLHIIEGAIALDLTERKLQTAAKKNGTPWTLAKSFHGSCPISSFFTIRRFEEIADLNIRLWVNDELRQEGTTAQMIFKPDVLVEYIKHHFPVCPGDLILTGTPKGVGAMQRGDTLRAEIEGQLTHSWRVI